MKLKLSTLAVIIAIIFFFYYYFIFAPCQPTVAPAPPMEGGGEESTNGMVGPPNGSMEETTAIEGFDVTPIVSDEEQVTYL